MFTLPSRYITEALVLLGITMLVFSASSRLSAMHARSFLTEVRAQIEATHTELTSRAAVLRAHKADAEVTELVKDCDERATYEEGLSRLSSDSPAGLARTKLLHDACGDFYVRQRAVMVLKVAESVATLHRTAALATAYTDNTEYAELLRVWDSIVVLERERQRGSAAHVALQGEIIDLLIARAPTEDVLRRAGDVAQSLAVMAVQVETLTSTEAALFATYAQMHSP